MEKIIGEREKKNEAGWTECPFDVGLSYVSRPCSLSEPPVRLKKEALIEGKQFILLNNSTTFSSSHKTLFKKSATIESIILTNVYKEYRLIL